MRMTEMKVIKFKMMIPNWKMKRERERERESDGWYLRRGQAIVEESRSAIIAKPRRAKLQVLPRRIHNSQYFSWYNFLGKMKLETIYMKWVERVTDINCRVTNCSANSDGIGYEPNEPNTINLWEWVKELGWWWVL